MKQKIGLIKVQLCKTSRFNISKTIGQKVNHKIPSFKIDSSTMDHLFRKLIICIANLEKPKNIMISMKFLNMRKNKIKNNNKQTKSPKSEAQRWRLVHLQDKSVLVIKNLAIIPQNHRISNQNRLTLKTFNNL